MLKNLNHLEELNLELSMNDLGENENNLKNLGSAIK